MINTSLLLILKRQGCSLDSYLQRVQVVLDFLQFGPAGSSIVKKEVSNAFDSLEPYGSLWFKIAKNGKITLEVRGGKLNASAPSRKTGVRENFVIGITQKHPGLSLRN